MKILGLKAFKFLRKTSMVQTSSFVLIKSVMRVDFLFSMMI